MASPPSATERAITIPLADVSLAADLAIPASAVGVVAFAHGSGSGRRSPRNRRVAERLGQGGLGTLLLDLLTEDEARRDSRTGELRFDIALLARRLVAAVDWLGREQSTAERPIGLFGASTGAAAALIAAAQRPEAVRAVVSRGGRPDLAAEALAKVTVPTLLVVGGNDPVVLDLNRKARAQLRCETDLQVIAAATHLFEEPGALETVADLACEWFITHLAGGGEPP